MHEISSSNKWTLHSDWLVLYKLHDSSGFVWYCWKTILFGDLCPPCIVLIHLEKEFSWSFVWYKNILVFVFVFFFCNSALQALPLNIDPIPKKVIQEFGLPSLYDVSVFVYFLLGF